MKVSRPTRLLLLSVFAGLLCGGLLSAAEFHLFKITPVSASEVVSSSSVSSTTASIVQEPFIATSTAAQIDTPLFLTISKIDLHVPIQEVGLTASSNMGIPTNYTDAGWFRFGPRPGQIGNATMDGHVVTRYFGAGVFSNLHALVPGDKVNIETRRTILTFRVVKVAIYDMDNAPLDEIFGPTSKRMLNFITCDGVWVNKRRMYSQRLVVFTELAGITAR